MVIQRVSKLAADLPAQPPDQNRALQSRISL